MANKKLSGRLFGQDFHENIWWAVLKIKGGEKNPQLLIKICCFFFREGSPHPGKPGVNQDPAYNQPGASTKVSDDSFAFAERLAVSSKKSKASKIPPKSASCGAEGPGAAWGSR